jgi:hypothetical protein
MVRDQHRGTSSACRRRACEPGSDIDNGEQSRRPPPDRALAPGFPVEGKQYCHLEYAGEEMQHKAAGAIETDR